MAGAKGILPSKAEIAGALDKTKSALSSVRSTASELRMKTKEMQQEIDALREEPYVDAAIGTAVSIAAGAVAGAADLMLPPLFNIGGTETKATVNGKEVTTYKGGINLTASAVGGAVLLVVGVTEKSKSVLDSGKAALAYWAGSQTQNLLSSTFSK